MTTLGSILAFYIHDRMTPRHRRQRRAKPPTWNPKYRAFVRSHPCAACGGDQYVEAAHTGPRGLSRKSDDLRTLPLCAWCHRGSNNALHVVGPVQFQAERGIWFSDIIADLNLEWKALHAARLYPVESGA